MTVARDQLDALREKYRTLIELRTTRDSLQATGSPGFDATAGSARVQPIAIRALRISLR